MSTAIGTERSNIVRSILRFILYRLSLFYSQRSNSTLHIVFSYSIGIVNEHTDLNVPVFHGKM